MKTKYFLGVNSTTANEAAKVLRDPSIGHAAPLLEGTLQLSTNILGCESSMFLHMRQTPKTASCVANLTYEFDQDLDPHHSCKKLWLLPLGRFEEYTCTQHVITESLGDFGRFVDTAKNEHTTTFIMSGQTYDDMMAMYTGVLSAVIGGVAQALGLLVGLAMFFLRYRYDIT